MLNRTQSLPPNHFRLLFEASPTPFLVLSPELVIVAVSNSYLRVTLTRRQEIVGRYIFDVFPSNPADPTAAGVHNLRDSLQRVLTSGVPDQMPVQRYDIQRPAQEGGGFEVRYWSPLNTPVTDEDGNVIYLIHRVEDVTSLVRMREPHSDANGTAAHVEHLQAELNRKGEEIKQANAELELIGDLLESEQASRKKAETAEADARAATQQLELAYTAQREATNALQIGEAKLEGIIRSAMDAIISVDEQQRIVLFNIAAEKMFQCPTEEAIGSSLDRFIPARFRQQHVEHVRRFGLSGTTTRSMQSPGLLTAVRTNGEEFPIEATISHVTVAGQKLFTVLLRDITERKTAEEALRQSEARFRSIYEYAAVGIEQVDLDGRLLMVNEALCNMVGYTQRELLDRGFSYITNAEDLEREQVLLERMLHGETSSYAMEKRYIHRDGWTVWVNVTSSLVKDSDGKGLYRISVIQNVTDRRRAEDQLLQVQKMEAVGRLSGGIAHDFNTLLGVMVGFSELALAELPKDSPTRNRIQQILSAAQTGASLTKQLLAFSRKQTVSPEVLDLRNSVLNVQSMLRRLLPEDIDLSIHTSEDACPVKADPGQLQQLLLNLSANARDAMPKGGSLTIEVRPVELDDAYVKQHALISPGRYVLLAVTDTGTGMDTETASHIFEPFFTTKSAGKGTGLGLATVYGIVKQSGGDIWVYSEPDLGSIFKVYLPFSYESIAARKAVALSPEKMTGDETILVVEDSKALRELTRELLTRQGYTVLEAEDGAKAIEICREHPEIRLLLTDIVMPKMRGTELAEHIAKIRPEIAVVFVSGYTEEALARTQNTARIRILEKPHTSDMLFSTVRQALDEKLNSAKN